jgi:DNA-directed RNA polymerase sigma subunit (sigma70/sigma32)
VSRKRDAVVRAMERLIEADEEVRRQLVVAERVLKRGIARVESGEDMATALAATRAADRREEINDALEALTLARSDLRITVLAAGLEEGMSLSEVARGFGISRQLVQRLAKEHHLTP